MLGPAYYSIPLFYCSLWFFFFESFKLTPTSGSLHLMCIYHLYLFPCSTPYQFKCHQRHMCNNSISSLIFRGKAEVQDNYQNYKFSEQMGMTFGAVQDIYVLLGILYGKNLQGTRKKNGKKLIDSSWLPESQIYGKQRNSNYQFKV